jgi:hypothetical protein
MGKSSAPAAPDPYTSAAAQYQYGTQAASYNAALNNVNQVGPTGSNTWNVTGYSPTGAPEYTQTQSLSPQEQAIFNQAQTNQQTSGQTAGNLAQQAQRSLESPLPTNPNAPPVQMQINTSGVPGIIGANDLSAYTQQQQQAAYANQMQYIQPQLQQQQEQLDNQLKESGAQPGSAAYNNAMTLFNNQAQQQQTNAYNNAYQTGLQAQQALYGESANTNQQMFGQGAAEQQAYNAAAGQQYGQELQGVQEQLALEQTPLSEYNALESGVGTNLPSFGLGGASGTGANVQAPNIEQAFQDQYSGQLAGYNANVASTDTDVGAGASIAAAIAIAM